MKAKQLVIPKGTGFYIEYCGNITGAFHRTDTDLPATFERYHGSSTIFSTEHPKLGKVRGMTRTDLLRDLDTSLESPCAGCGKTPQTCICGSEIAEAL